jgi:hypothetical protein
MKKKLSFRKKFPALWTCASESGHLVQIFDSVSIVKILSENISQN